MTAHNEASSLHYEEPHISPNLEKPELLQCFAVANVGGGVLVEQLLGSEHLALITFAAIECKQRNNGVGTELVKYAQEALSNIEVNLVGVQLNLGDDRGFWLKQGLLTKNNIKVLLYY